MTLHQPAATTSPPLTGVRLCRTIITKACWASREPDEMPTRAPCHSHPSDRQVDPSDDCQNPFPVHPVKDLRFPNPERVPSTGPTACAPTKRLKRGLAGRHWYPDLAAWTQLPTCFCGPSGPLDSDNEPAIHRCFRATCRLSNSAIERSTSTPPTPPNPASPTVARCINRWSGPRKDRPAELVQARGRVASLALPTPVATTARRNGFTPT